MQGQGRGGAPGTGGDGGGSSSGSYGGPGGLGFGYGINYYSAAAPEDYGYGYGYWGFGLPLPSPPPFPQTLIHGRGVALRPPSIPLGVQGGGILKRNSQGYFVHGRGHARGHGGGGRFSSGGRGGKNLTKEALDADLDEWRLKDKRYAGQSLDAELDDYWRKKDTSEESKADAIKGVDVTKLSPKKHTEGV